MPGLLQALSAAVSRSLSALQRQLLPTTSQGPSLLETGVILSMPHVIVSPKLEAIQHCIDNIVQEVSVV